MLLPAYESVDFGGTSVRNIFITKQIIRETRTEL